MIAKKHRAHGIIHRATVRIQRATARIHCAHGIIHRAIARIQRATARIHCAHGRKQNDGRKIQNNGGLIHEYCGRTLDVGLWIGERSVVIGLYMKSSGFYSLNFQIITDLKFINFIFV